VVIHALLQHLPDVPEPHRAEAASRAAASRAYGLEDTAAVAGEALRLLAAPGLAALFGPGSRAEQPISGIVANRVITGQVDRLVILPDRILIADYKTGRSAPATPDAVPVLYLRQMAAYRAVLRLLYPDRDVHCLLIWTEGPDVIDLPPALLDSHAPASRAA
jgi:ATP-dependent helicase/nuclease subunit A